jgi:glycosyltransferase involved in cell wall biosynthesis
MHIVHVADAPIPYDTPVLNHLSRLAPLHVIYMSPGHSQYGFANLWGESPQFSYTVRRSGSVNLRRLDLWAQFSPGVSLALQHRDPDVVLLKSWNMSAIEPLLWKTVMRRKCVMWSESTSFSGVFRGRISNAVRALMLARVDAFVSNGTMATRYLHELGVPPDHIVTSCLASPLADSAIASRAFAAPVQGGADGPRFLFVGRLTPRKRPLELIHAFSRVVVDVPAAHLAIVGDGPLMAEVAAAASRLGESVSLLGRCEGDALAAVYQEADILVVPSVREVWGLVVNEALAHGLHVIATDQVSSALDLVDASSGTIVPADDLSALSAGMATAARAFNRNPALRARRASRVAHRSTAAFAVDIQRAIELAVSRGRAGNRGRRAKDSEAAANV